MQNIIDFVVILSYGKLKKVIRDNFKFSCNLSLLRVYVEMITHSQRSLMEKYSLLMSPNIFVSVQR